ncbi:hypothetical protein KEM60_02485 [Austwickia sp. TVS 96-490-7B]|uniref:mycothiol transferase n=1 Tax=Austwickia sp. TVS 96-490-7B TaxID=2830843 RepID=UPI001C5A585C|nr:DUF664 domain-containing protein [Austwickia sp. TVS 96-490-7B]MBW3086273.1 hypothetical protein [Austwickia sp. TVS 96-490-7B]
MEHDEMIEQIEAQLNDVIEMAQILAAQNVDRAPLPSAWSVAGLLNHQRYVTRFWIANVIAGKNLPVPWTDDSPDEDWTSPDGATVSTCSDELLAEWRTMREVLAAYPPGEPACEAGEDGTRPSVAWVLAHLLAEVSRHAGHLDIVHELHRARQASNDGESSGE